MRLHHLGIAVSDLSAALALFESAVGAELERRGRTDEMEFALLRVGGVELELLHSSLPGSAVEKFLQSRGPGMHHLAFEVADLDGELERLRAAGVEQAGGVREGVHGTRVAFLHPRSMGGVLTELVERAP